ncbi:MAG TPA: Rrf2 family transcriptional regulator [Gemmatimonadales bacterium]|jgi:Rrf2 family protein
MLSQTAEYALRTVLYLADRGDDRLVGADQLASALGVPRNYLSKTLHRLTRERILASARGKGGGFRLATDPKRLTLLQVIEPFDAISAERRCLLGRPTCDDRHPCPAHHRWKAVSTQVADFFRRTTVAELIAGTRGAHLQDRSMLSSRSAR